ncbi:MAG TPA: hypothetical protein VEA69_02930 [Tepidisphaeraceae bacterium]|nr:hypothetical protein [Tepidisphaeraceae bacterium]
MRHDKIRRLEFEGFHGRPATCDLEVVGLPDGRTLVIATERDDNPGVSVTNFAEGQATIVVNRFGLDPERLVWIEHYPASPCPLCARKGRRQGILCRVCGGRRTRRESPTFDLVTFTIVRPGNRCELIEPRWRPAAPADWQAFGFQPCTQR